MIRVIISEIDVRLADKGLNPQAQAVEEAQTEIRLAVRDGWLKNEPKAKINATVQRIIRAALKEISLPELRSAAYRSLNAFAERQYNTYLSVFGNTSDLLMAMLVLAAETPNPAAYARAQRTVLSSSRVEIPPLETSAKGIPLQMFAKDYFERYVVPTFYKIVEQKALDPDDISGSNSLRNRAEMEVRYNAHLQSIDELRTAGVRLVVCSVHADCSKRCSQWQGRVYSLDGTSGTTDDGKPFVPLEKATDVYYTTKAGKTYKNGLLGFNCRHKLYPYSVGMIIPHVSEAEQAKERAIDRRQRELERRVRDYKERALIFKNIDRERYLKSKRLANKWRSEYIRFSHENGRAYYPSRIKLL